MGIGEQWNTDKYWCYGSEILGHFRFQPQLFSQIRASALFIVLIYLNLPLFDKKPEITKTTTNYCYLKPSHK